jgi:phenylpropionate dioxygenase-like ring-hydroxylating dioxygenase large terminal subunit
MIWSRLRRARPPTGTPTPRSSGWRGRIFARTWQYAGRADRVSNPGDFFTCFAGQIPIVVVRDTEGVLRGFVNVCRHRGHLIAEGDGNRKALQCPYHAWTYDLDGTLRKAPRSEREPDFDAAGYSMLPVATEAWGPLVFVNPDPDAGPLADALGPLPGHVAESGLDVDRLRFRVRNDWEIECDWKVAMNYRVLPLRGRAPGFQGDRRRPDEYSAGPGARVQPSRSLTAQENGGGPATRD